MVVPRHLHGWLPGRTMAVSIWELEGLPRRESLGRRDRRERWHSGFVNLVKRGRGVGRSRLALVRRRPGSYTGSSEIWVSQPMVSSKWLTRKEKAAG